MLNGWIILDKPLGLGSTQAVGAVKRALREGGYPKVKIGHGGTLDPLATGVLPIALGEATKLAGRMLDSDKIYEFTVNFGAETDSLDLEGTVIAESDVRPNLADIVAILPRFTGPIEQVPPAFSAIKVDGKRAYDLARAGEAVELKSRAVVIYALDLNTAPERGGGPPRSGGGGADGRAPLPVLRSAVSSIPLHHPSAKTLDGPPPRVGEVLESITLTAHVSKGTYIRSLARDIAYALGTVGHVTMLRRIKAGPFTCENAISLDILFEKSKATALEDITLPLRTALDDIPALALSPEQARLIRNGQVLTGIAAPDGLSLVTLEETPVALVLMLDGTATVERGFNL
jgi:tRNA pseudouridine55 synthase